jgi:hypothetical protein
MRRTGHKLELIDGLNHVAQMVTQTTRPTTHQWNGENISHRLVYKREFSSGATHVHVPLKGSTLTTQQQMSVSSKTKYKWLEQSYIPLYEQYGEWRVFMIGGNPTLVIRTHRDGSKLSSSLLEHGYTLSEMKYVRLIFYVT